ncbi:MAG: PQQ-binding-like beta-propeller repeat protein [Spirochaetales bacterium]|nr:PQQ-binding-like beta-propeller repeat protein [Spirochaetales bacterium]
MKERMKMKINLLICCFILAGGLIYADNNTFPWPVFRGNQQLTGAVDSTLPDNPQLLWTYKTGDAVRSTPVISGNMVFTGSDDGGLYALDLLTGKKIWVFTTEDAIEAPPLLAFDTLYFGTLGGVFYAVDMATGRAKWQYNTDAQISGSANYTTEQKGKKKLIVFGSYDNNLYCLDALTGKKIWSFKAKSYINGAASLYNQSFVFGGCDAMIRVIRAWDGKELFHIDAGSYIPGSVAVNGDYAFAGHYGNKLICIDLVKKKISWEFGDKEEGAPFFSSPASGNGNVLIASEDGILYCIDQQTGKLKWKYLSADEVKGSPVIAGNKVVLCSGDGYVYFLDITDGKKIWSYETGDSISGSPAVAGEMVIFGADDGVIYAFGKGKK